MTSKEEISSWLSLAMHGKALWEERVRSWTGKTPLDVFLRHAARTTPAYRQFADRPLTDFPPFNRQAYQQAPERFLSESVGNGPSLHHLETSGTTGNPLHTAYDAEAWYCVNFQFYEDVRKTIGLPSDLFRPGSPGVLFITNKSGRLPLTAVLPSLTNSLYVRLNLPEAEIEAGDQHFLRSIEKLAAPLLYGKPTYLLELRSMLRCTPNRAVLRPRAILTSGERLYPDDRKRLEETFRAPVVNAYSSTEGGLMAVSCPRGDGLHVLGDRVVLEILDGGRVLPDGRGEILVTNMTNWATCFIRYRTGDLGELTRQACPCGHQGATLRGLWGRDPSHTDLNGIRVDTDELTRMLAAIMGIADFQLVKEPDGELLLRWMAEGEVREDWVLLEVARLLAQAGITGPLRLERTERITPRGWKKRRYLVPPSSGPRIDAASSEGG